jgi:hypothetical protein
MGSKFVPERRFGPVQQHPDVVAGHSELAGNLVVTQVFEAGEAEDLSLPRIEFGKRFT